MRTLKITSWNINGISRKSLNITKTSEDEFLGSVLPYDIIGLIETHTGPDDNISIKGYKTFQCNRPKASRANKFSGGLAILVRNNISKGVSLSKSGNYSIWLKLDKSFFGHTTDLYLCIAYLPPGNSTYSRHSETDCLNTLEQQVQHFSTLGNIIIMGDLNARTSCNNDHIIDDTDKFLNNYLPYNIDKALPRRASQDKIVNDRGSNLLDLCISSSLRILNGRKPGDSLGYFTCHKYNGSSLVDYGIVSESLFDDILYFQVHKDISDLSDHSQISMCIHNLNVSSETNDKIEQIPIERGFRWDDFSEYNFQQALNNMSSPINDFMLENFDHSGNETDLAVNKFNDILITACNKSLQPYSKINKSRNKQKKKPDKKWYGPSLKTMKSNLKKLGRLLHNNPYDSQIRENYFCHLKLYKKK